MSRLTAEERDTIRYRSISTDEDIGRLLRSLDAAEAEIERLRAACSTATSVYVVRVKDRFRHGGTDILAFVDRADALDFVGTEYSDDDDEVPPILEMIPRPEL